jgi:hypothetical protein
MAITVNGANPTQVIVVSNTVTTNDTHPTGAPSARNYVFADNIVGAVNAGVGVGGFGLRLETTLAAGVIAMTNNGLVTVDQGTPALELIGNGGAVTYAGTGHIDNDSDVALRIDNDAAGTIEATLGGNVTSGDGAAVDIDAVNGTVTFTQAAGTFSTSFGVASPVALIGTGAGDIVANLNGTILGMTGGLGAFSSTGNVTVNLTGTITTPNAVGISSASDGAITFNSSGHIDTDTGVALEAEGGDTGLVTINVTGGQLNAGSDGIEARANGTGGILINMTGGQIGDEQHLAGGGISARSDGAGGDVDVTATTIFANNGGISAQITNPLSSGNINLTTNGTIDGNGDGILADNDGSGRTNITNNGFVRGFTAVSVAVLSAPANVFNAGTLTGSSGTAVTLSGDADQLTLAPTSVINGNVLARGGNDALHLGGAGTGNFNVSDIGAGQQYQDFEAFRVMSGTWLLTGATGENWNVLGGTLGGTATIGDLAAGSGTVAPGASIGILSTGNLSFSEFTNFAVEIGGPNPGTGHDQIAVTGTVNLNGIIAPLLTAGFSRWPAPASSSSTTTAPTR